MLMWLEYYHKALHDSPVATALGILNLALNKFNTTFFLLSRSISLAVKSKGRLKLWYLVNFIRDIPQLCVSLWRGMSLGKHRGQKQENASFPNSPPGFASIYFAKFWSISGLSACSESKYSRYLCSISIMTNAQSWPPPSWIGTKNWSQSLKKYFNLEAQCLTPSYKYPFYVRAL